MQAKYALSALALIVISSRASASTFVITDDVTYPGAVSVTQLNAANSTITPTVSYSIGNAYNGAPISGDFPSTVATGAGGPWNFYDDYVFTVGASGSSIQSALISFNTLFSGINDLQGRIIAVNGTFDASANLGVPASGNTLVDSWTNTSTVAGVNTVTLAGTTFGPGTYDLQIRGEVLGGASASGAYGGAITFTPVPLPAALPLFLSGLGLFATLRKRSAR